MHLHRIDHNRNMARFYSMQVQKTLFGEWTLLREWALDGTVREHLPGPDRRAETLHSDDADIAAVEQSSNQLLRAIRDDQPVRRSLPL